MVAYGVNVWVLELMICYNLELITIITKSDLQQHMSVYEESGLG